MSQQSIILLMGLPGSGKSTWAAGRGVGVISTDEVRRLLADDPTNQKIHERVFATVRYLVRQRLATGRPETVVDATHLTRAERKPYFAMAEWYDCAVDGVFFQVPIAECLRRNALRGRVVPPEAILAMSAKLQYPELGEGFRRLTRVD